jgi:hypothetical protein
MFYIYIPNQPAYRESNSEIPDSTIAIDRNSLVQHHQRQVKEMQRRIRENYYLERRFFI